MTAEDLIRDMQALTEPGGAHGTTIHGTQRPSNPAPRGWEPGVKFLEAGAMTVVTGPTLNNVTRDENAWRGMVEDLGLAVPPGYAVRLAEAKYDPAAWHRDTEFTEYPDGLGDEAADGHARKSKHTKTPAVTRAVWRYRFVIEPASEQMHTEDVGAIIAEVMRARRKQPPAAPAAAKRRSLNVVYADPQAGKVAILGGTQALAHRVADSFDLLKDHVRDLKKVGRMATEAAWWDGGDCIEGFSNVRAQERTNDLHMTQQIRAHRRFTVHGLGVLAGIFPEVSAYTAGSNHARVREGKDPVGPPGDDWGLEVMSQVQDAYALNPDAYGHVKFGYPNNWRDTLSTDSGGLQVGLAHGHQFRSGDTKAVASWWQGQTFGEQPVANARVLITGHFHHFAAREMGNGRLWIQAPTLDNGSDWFTAIAGEVSVPGLLVFSSTEDGWDDLRILRAK